MDVLEFRLMFYCKKYIYFIVCCVLLMDICRFGGVICFGGGFIIEKKVILIF